MDTRSAAASVKVDSSMETVGIIDRSKKRAGQNQSKMNAYKHGAYNIDSKKLNKMIAEQRKCLRDIIG